MTGKEKGQWKSDTKRIAIDDLGIEGISAASSLRACAASEVIEPHRAGHARRDCNRARAPGLLRAPCRSSVHEHEQ
jgi:hypothetical protein